MENKLKISKPNTFSFVGKAIINDKSFIINKTNEKGTWCYNSISLGIDCGDHGVNFINGMAGFSPVNDNVIYISTVDENNRIQTKEHDKKIAWEDRLDLTEDLLKTINKQKLIRVRLDGDNTKMFLSMYDAIPYIKEHISDGAYIYAKGRINLYQDGDGKWLPRHEVESIGIADEKSVARTELKYNVLIDENTMGTPDPKTLILPLYCRTLTYIGKMNENKYNQICAVPIKILVDLNRLSTDGKPDKKKIGYARDMYFAPSEKDMVSEGVFVCHYVGGVQKVEVTMEDLPKELREGIENGILDKEKVMNSMVIKKPIERDLMYTTVDSYLKTVDNDGAESVIPVTSFEKNRYKESELIEFDDLIPIEESSSSDNGGNKKTSTKKTETEDVDIDEDISDILAMFN